MFFVLFVTALSAYFLLLFPGDIGGVGKALVSQSFLVSNVHFMLDGTYFGFQSANNPLLHTWTLSVEEQFYILFPLLMIGAYAWKKRWWLMIGTVLVVSLISSVYLADIAPSANILQGLDLVTHRIDFNKSIGFYFIASRAWELLVGALVFFVASKWSLKPLFRTLFSVGGLMCIVYSIVVLDVTASFPGMRALIPTVGTALIIWSGSEATSRVHTMLSVRPLVLLGLISYSFYLWHWPMIVFLQTYGVQFDALWAGWMFAVLCVLSYISYRYIEQPIRKRRALASNTAFVATMLATLVFLVLLGYVLQRPASAERIPQDIREVGLIETDIEGEYLHCQTSDFYMIDSEKKGPCLLGAEASKDPVRGVLWGDSHARVIAPIIDELAREKGIAVAFFADNGCVPVPGVVTRPVREFCTQTTRYAIDFIEHENVPIVILVANWDAHINGWGDSIYSDIQLAEESHRLGDDATPEEIFKTYFDELAQRFLSEGRQLYILDQMPIHDTFNRRDAFYYRLLHGDLPKFDTLAYDDYLAEMGKVRDVFSALTEYRNVHVLDPADILCDVDSKCDLMRNGKVLYYDRSHLDYIGASLLRPLLKEIF